MSAPASSRSATAESATGTSRPSLARRTVSVRGNRPSRATRSAMARSSSRRSAGTIEVDAPPERLVERPAEDLGRGRPPGDDALLRVDHHERRTARRRGLQGQALAPAARSDATPSPESRTKLSATHRSSPAAFTTGTARTR